MPGKSSEKEPTRARGFRLPESLWEALSQAAKLEGMSRNAYVVRALRDALSASLAHSRDREEKVLERERLKAALRGDYDDGKA